MVCRVWESSELAERFVDVDGFEEDGGYEAVEVVGYEREVF
jgi:hypothetical protein